MQTYHTPYALIIPGQIIYYDIQPDKNSDWWGWYQWYLNTQEWRDKAAKCKSDANHQCSRCGAKAGDISADGGRIWLEAHHDKANKPDVYSRAGKENDSDLVCLCNLCHDKEHKTQP